MSEPKMKNGLQIGDDGNIITKPVMGWSTVSAAGVAVIVVIHYVDTPAELQTGNSKQIQLILRPEMCQEMSVSLSNAAKLLLQNRPEDKPLN